MKNIRITLSDADDARLKTMQKQNDATLTEIVTQALQFYEAGLAWAAKHGNVTFAAPTGETVLALGK